jgi:hypothetical protein
MLTDPNKVLNGELTIEELEEILSLTVFEDRELKLTLFLILLLTYTEDSQCNQIIKGPTTSGKSYNVNECLWFFPKEDILEFAGASPTSFIYRKSAKLIDVRTGLEWAKPKPQKNDPKQVWDEWFDFCRNSALFLDYSKKIIVFPDSPDTRLLAKLRPVLSHDKRESMYSVADKSKKGIQTKDIIIKGFFSNVFCTASSDLDEQESSRNFLLSPSDDQNKIRKSLDLIARKNSDVIFQVWYNNEPCRVALKQRVRDIREAKVKEIFIPAELMEELKTWFIENSKMLSFTSQRLFPRLISLAKASALANWKFRSGTTINTDIIMCNKQDIENAKSIYRPILECNELGLTPEEFELWKILEPHCSLGLTVKDVHNLYFGAKKRQCSDKRLRGILVNFCRSGLLREDKDGRTLRYYAISEKPEPEPESKDKLESKSKPETQDPELLEFQKGDSL